MLFVSFTGIEDVQPVPLYPETYYTMHPDHRWRSLRETYTYDRETRPDYEQIDKDLQ